MTDSLGVGVGGCWADSGLTQRSEPSVSKEGRKVAESTWIQLALQAPNCAVLWKADSQAEELGLGEQSFVRALSLRKAMQIARVGSFSRDMVASE